MRAKKKPLETYHAEFRDVTPGFRETYYREYQATSLREATTMAVKDCTRTDELRGVARGKAPQ